MAEPVKSGQEAADRLKAAGVELLAEVASMPAGLVTWKPADDVWSVMEILCHVDEFVPFWTGQALSVVKNPTGEWGRDHTDTNRLAAVNAAPTRRVADVERSIREGVEESARSLSALGDADLRVEAKSRNPRWGVQPVAFIIGELIVGHVEKHIGQIRRNIRQFDERSRS